MAELLLLMAAVPSVGLALAAGYAPGFLPLALLAYYTYPLLLMAGGQLLRGRWRERLPENLLRHPMRLPLMALSLPYPVYWAAAGALGEPWLQAYGAFLRGPGLAIPLAVLVLQPLGMVLPPALVSLLVLAASFGAEWTLRRTLL